MTKRLPIVRNDGHTWGRHSTSFDAIRMSFGHSTVIPNANLDCFFLPFLVNRRGRYASKWRSFSFGGQSIGDPGEGVSLAVPRHSTRQICHRMTTIFIPGQFHRQPTGGVPFVVPRHSTRPNCIQMTVIFIWWSIHRRSRGRVSMSVLCIKAWFYNQGHFWF